MTQDRFDFLLGICDEAFARFDKVGSFELLTEIEQVFVCIWALRGQVDNGGFHQYYFNGTGDLAMETVEALKHIGAKHTSDLLIKSNSYFENGVPPKNREIRIEQLSKLTEQSETELEDLDDIMYLDKDGLDDLMYVFVTQYGGQVPKP